MMLMAPITINLESVAIGVGSLDNATPTAKRPLHHAVSLALISPDSEQCGEDLALGLSG